MKELKIEINMKVYQSEELSAEDQELVNRAIEATGNAYAPYSKFQVGAALRLKNGHVIIGANQENAAFPSGLCAERSAVFAAQANYPDQPIETIAIAARNGYGLMAQPVTPCGSCRQVILGIEDRYKQPVRILLYGTKGVIEAKTIRDLIPLSFVDNNMK